MYDYIIVGAGSAGCVLANRLSANQERTVLLLEAGQSDKRTEVRVPVAFSKLFKTELDWNYVTEPQPHLDRRQLYWPRGKMLGGSSSMNAMIYIRGHRQDYDDWAAAGNRGWRYAEVLPYFKRAQHQERGASAYHGTGGPLNVADLRDPNPLSQAFVYAGIESGLPANNDFNGAQQEGVGYYQVTQKRGARHSAADAYLQPIRHRPNLTILTQAHATRILFEGDAAVGVEYLHQGSKQEARASAEVILCGGAINSPQLLLLSGIGPADQLRALGIPVRVDLPGVGQNLQDHPALAVTYACTQPVSLSTAESAGNLARYFLLRKGQLTSNVAEAGAFIPTRAGEERPDLQFHFAPVYFIDNGFVVPAGHGFTIGVTLVRPQSRGYLALRSADPLQAPLLQPNYCATDADWRTLLDGIKLARRVVRTAPFAPFRGAEITPGAAVQDDARLRAFVRTAMQTLYHPVGTCKMGNDPLAVVDDQLRVCGVRRLRVADAGIMPTIINGNTNAPTIMIAEKAADLIRGAVIPAFAQTHTQPA